MTQQTTSRQIEQCLTELTFQGKPQTTIRSYSYDLLALEQIGATVTPSSPATEGAKERPPHA